jgi:hypothetical protein
MREEEEIPKLSDHSFPYCLREGDGEWVKNNKRGNIRG